MSLHCVEDDKMEISVDSYEKLGAFYLGREYDLESKEMQDDLLLYDSKDLVTHGVVLGMTGSGKTGLCVGLLEEAAMDGIPAIVIDPKGDIANLMLTFPDFKGSDFRPWVNEDDARKKGKTPDEFAQSTADMWKDGIASWGQGPERVKQFQDKVDINVFTPGSKAGVPVSVLSSLDAPPFEIMDDGEALGERIESTVSSLLSLVGVDADPIQSSEAVFLSAIFSHCWGNEENLSLESLIRHIQKPPFGKVGVLDIDSFFSSKDRQKLALKFNNLLASPGFKTWLEGPPLDIQRMLYTEEGQPRVSIFSIAHLSDSERMFFVSLLLNQMLGWMRTQSGTTSLRALLYMDEIYGYLPPTANPPSKKPLMTILKQGRAFGLGTLLATQNPVDLDYKALSNTGTWWLGRLQTERDKARVLEGLEGAAGSTGAKFNKGAMEQKLAGLGKRVFMMNNVNDDEPTVFHVRWVMSYLRGPLTRGQIKTLMDPKRDRFSDAKPAAKGGGNPMSMGGSSSQKKTERPLVGDGVTEYFVSVAGDAGDVMYQPTLLRQATVHFSSTKANVDGARVVRRVSPMNDDGIDWDEAIVCATPMKALEKEPRDDAGFAELPGYAMNASNYKPVEKEFIDWAYRNERVAVFYSPDFKEYSQMGEAEGDFRARLGLKAREVRDDAIEPLREKYEKKIRTKTDQMERAQNRVEKEAAEASSAKWQAGASIIGGLLGGLLGGRRSRASKIGAATRAYKQHKDVAHAEEQVERYQRDVAELEEELRQEIEELEANLDPSQAELETLTIKPYKKDIDLEAVCLLWLPYDEDGEPRW